MKIPLFGLGLQGRSSNVTAQHRLNLYYDIQQQGDKSMAQAFCTPGVALVAAPSSERTRGIWQMESKQKLFCVQGRTFFELSYNGTATPRGTLDGNDTDGRVSMSDNGTQVLIASNGHGYLWDTGTNQFYSAASHPEFPGATTCCFLDSYFVVNKPQTGQFWLSGSYDGATWSGLDFATAESNPDLLVAVVADRGGLVLFGELSVELWYNSGALDFPFQRIQGAPADSGLAATWSLAKCGGMWTGLFRNRQSQVFFGRLDGYTIHPISPPDLDYLINRYADPEDAIAFAYTSSGHAFYQCTFQREGVTWLYDATTGLWSQLQSYGLSRHIGDLAVAYGRYSLVTDYRNGNLYLQDPALYTENGNPVIREITDHHIFAPDTLNWTRIRRLRVDMETGVGFEPQVTPTECLDMGPPEGGICYLGLDGGFDEVLVLGDAGGINNPQTDATIMLQISRDGGHTWGTEMWTTFGTLGEYLRRAEWRRLGRARDWVLKLRITDPVKTVLIGAYVEIDEAEA